MKENKQVIHKYLEDAKRCIKKYAKNIGITIKDSGWKAFCVSREF